MMRLSAHATRVVCGVHICAFTLVCVCVCVFAGEQKETRIAYEQDEGHPKHVHTYIMLLLLTSTDTHTHTDTHNNAHDARRVSVEMKPKRRLALMLGSTVSYHIMISTRVVVVVVGGSSSAHEENAHIWTDIAHDGARAQIIGRSC